MKSVNELYIRLQAELAQQKHPPVGLWQPERSGEIDIRIDRDGIWSHEGRRINRAGLVRVFASILRKDAEGYFLVTPAERLRIAVADVPFVVVDVDAQGTGEAQSLLLTTNVGDLVELDAAHELQMREGQPYVRVRDDLFARVNRATYYRLVEYGNEEAGNWIVPSCGARFSMGAV